MGRGIGLNRFGDELALLRDELPRSGKLRRNRVGVRQRFETVEKPGQRCQAFREPREIARTDPPNRDAPDDPLDVADVLEAVEDSLQPRRAFQQRRDRPLPRLDVLVFRRTDALFLAALGSSLVFVRVMAP